VGGANRGEGQAGHGRHEDDGTKLWAGVASSTSNGLLRMLGPTSSLAVTAGGSDCTISMRTQNHRCQTTKQHTCQHGLSLVLISRLPSRCGGFRPCSCIVPSLPVTSMASTLLSRNTGTSRCSGLSGSMLLRMV